jgi:3-isopropylmalate dehydrogenase
VIELAVLAGDGVGPAVVSSATRVLDAVQSRCPVSVECVECPVGWDAYEAYGTTLPNETLAVMEECDAAVLGPVASGEYPEDDGLRGNPSGTIRTRFDLFANVRPSRSYDGIGPEGMDLTVFRQNTEGFYADRNMAAGEGMFKPTPDVALSVGVVTEFESLRIARQAFEFAESEGKDTVVAVHKANVLRYGDGLFLEACRRVADDYPGVTLSDEHVDAFAMNLVRRPAAYDVVVTTNLYGDILSDEAAGIVGSIGLAPGLNVGDSYAVAQATHGAAPDIAGEGVANPAAMILSVSLLLDWFESAHDVRGAGNAADLIASAVAAALNDGSTLTPDLGGDATTDEFTDAVIAALGT